MVTSNNIEKYRVYKISYDGTIWEVVAIINRIVPIFEFGFRKEQSYEHMKVYEIEYDTDINKIIKVKLLMDTTKQFVAEELSGEAYKYDVKPGENKDIKREQSGKVQTEIKELENLFKKDNSNIKDKG